MIITVMIIITMIKIMIIIIIIMNNNDDDNNRLGVTFKTNRLHFKIIVFQFKLYNDDMYWGEVIELNGIMKCIIPLIAVNFSLLLARILLRGSISQKNKTIYIPKSTHDLFHLHNILLEVKQKSALP